MTRPTCPSQLRLNPTHRPLAAVAHAEQRKHDKYGAICEAEGVTLVPFAVETYGGLSRDALKLLDTLAEQCDTTSPTEWKLHARATIAVALQIGNAASALKGIQLVCAKSLQLDERPCDPQHRMALAYPSTRRIVRLQRLCDASPSTILVEARQAGADIPDSMVLD